MRGFSVATNRKMNRAWARLSSWNLRPRSGQRRARGCPAPKSAGLRVLGRGAGGGTHKTALVLGGGGFTGGVYEIGALRALDLMATNSTVNQFDVYVGTSAGSFIAALCANGVTPEEMMRVVTHQGKAPFRDVDLGDLLHLNLAEFARKGALLPLRMVSLGTPGGGPAGAACRRWTSCWG